MEYKELRDTVSKHIIRRANSTKRTNETKYAPNKSKSHQNKTLRKKKDKTYIEVSNPEFLSSHYYVREIYNYLTKYSTTDFLKHPQE